MVETKQDVFFSFYLFSRSSCFGVGLAFSALVNAAYDDSFGGSDNDGYWDEFSAGAGITGIAAASYTSRSWELPSECFLFAFPLKYLLYTAILCTFFFVLNFLSSNIFLWHQLLNPNPSTSSFLSILQTLSAAHLSCFSLYMPQYKL